MRLSIVDRYILREAAQVWVAVTAILILILVFGMIYPSIALLMLNKNMVRQHLK